MALIIPQIHVLARSKTECCAATYWMMMTMPLLTAFTVLPE